MTFAQTPTRYLCPSMTEMIVVPDVFVFVAMITILVLAVLLLLSTTCSPPKYPKVKLRVDTTKEPVLFKGKFDNQRISKYYNRDWCSPQVDTTLKPKLLVTQDRIVFGYAQLWHTSYYARVKSIPIRQIKQVDVVETLDMQTYGLAKVEIETGAEQGGAEMIIFGMSNYEEFVTLINTLTQKHK